MIVIGVTGTYRAGKGAIVEYLVESRGFKHYSVSKFIHEWLRLTKAPESRDDLIKGGNELRRKYGADSIVRSLFKRAGASGKNAVIESIRNPKEAEFIKSRPDGFLIAVDADPEKRFNRTKKVGGIKDNVTFDEFRLQEEREMHSADPNAQDLRKCIEMADFKIQNDETLEELHQRVEGVLKEIELRGKERKN